jgi:cystinosin
MGYFKIAITTLKYLPQMYWNYKRKTTLGWSIFNILMDITGGLLSFLQTFLEHMFGEEIKINIVKFILGILVVIYDIIFILQHYVFYRDERKNSVRLQN